MSTRKKLPDTGIKTDGTKRTADATVRIFGKVTLIKGYDLSDFVGCHALVQLNDTPSKTVAILTDDHGLQSLLETAFVSRKSIVFSGQRLPSNSPPGGGTWAVEAYATDSIILYSSV